MFSSDKKTKSSPELSREQNKIAQGTRIKGDIEAKGGLRIDGHIEGSIKTPGKVVIGKEGSVKGEIECENADIEGKFSGKLHIAGTLSLKASAVIEGEVFATRLAIEPGAGFNATCTMKGAAVKALNNETRKGQKTEQSA